MQFHSEKQQTTHIGNTTKEEVGRRKLKFSWRGLQEISLHRRVVRRLSSSIVVASTKIDRVISTTIPRYIYKYMPTVNDGMGNHIPKLVTNKLDIAPRG